jgi:hypothetical protein
MFMSKARFSSSIFAALVLIVLSNSVSAARAQSASFTRDFRLERCTWSPFANENPLFNLRPGLRTVLEGEEEDNGDLIDVRIQITVLREVEPISFTTASGRRINLMARVVEEREWKDGELVEVALNWFARCKETSDVYYFGEAVDNYENGQIANHNGSWRAGVDGALPGLFMPGTFLLGARYFQEIAPAVALDQGENKAMNLTLETPAGTFRGCVQIDDTDALKPDAGADAKFYCPGLGLTRDEDNVLVSRTILPPGAP